MNTQVNREIFTDESHNKKLVNFLKDYCKMWTQRHFMLYNQMYRDYCNNIKSGKFRIDGLSNPKISDIDLYFCQKFVDEYKKKYNSTPVRQFQKEVENRENEITNVDNQYYQPQDNFPLNNEPFDTLVVNNNDKQTNIQKNTSVASEQSFSKLFEINVPKEPFVLDVPERDNVEYTLILDSRDRDIINYPYPENFTILIENTLKNIQQITLDEIITPNWNVFVDEPYSFIIFKEVDNVYIYNGSNPLYSKVFTQVYPDTISRDRRYIVQYPTNNTKLYKTNPLASLARLSPTIIKSDGSPLNMYTDVFEILDTLECVVDGITFYRFKLKNIFRNLSVEYYNWLNSVCKMNDIINVVYKLEEKPNKINHQIRFMTLGSVNDFLNGIFYIDTYVNTDIETIYNKNININSLVYYEPVEKKYCDAFIFLRKISFFYSIIIKLQEYNARTIPSQILI